MTDAPVPPAQAIPEAAATSVAAQPAISVFDPLADVDVKSLGPKILDWLNLHIVNANTLYQIIIILASFVFSSIVYRILKPHVVEQIEKLHLNIRYTRICHSISRLLLPFIALIVIGVMTKIANSDIVGVDVWLVHGMMKALIAWIIIRIIVQFIENSAIRNSFSGIIWIIAALSIFGMLNDTIEFLDGFGMDIGQLRLSLFSVLKGIFFICILIYLAGILSRIADQKISKSKNLTRSSKALLEKMVRVILIVLAVIIGITTSGIDLSLFAVFGGAIGVGLGFGLQKGVANLFSGMMLLFDRSIQPGDIIELDNGTVGKIEHMAVRYTEIITLDNKSILIPNEELITKRVINWSHGNSLIRVSVKFGVHYDSDPHKVIKVAVEAAKNVHRVVSLPSDPACFMTEFGDSAINFTLGFWINDPENGLGNVKGEVMLALWDAFKAQGISIPYPHREVYMHQA